MEEIYKQQLLVEHLNEAIKTLLDELFTKLNEAYLCGVYFIDLAVEYGKEEDLEANAKLIEYIKKLGAQHKSLKNDFKEAQNQLCAMCNEKFNSLSTAICGDDKLMNAYLAGEYQLAVSLGGVIPFLTRLSKIA